MTRLSLLLILLVVVVCIFVYTPARCQDERPQRPHRPTGQGSNRKKHRTRTTSTTPLPADSPQLTDTVVVTDKPLLTDNAGVPILNENKLENSTDEANAHHHIPSPFIYSTETLNKTHANMFKK